MLNILLIWIIPVPFLLYLHGRFNAHFHCWFGLNPDANEAFILWPLLIPILFLKGAYNLGCLIFELGKKHARKE